MTQCTDIPTRVRAIEGDPRLSRRVVERFNRLPYRAVLTVREAVVFYGLNTVETMARRCREQVDTPAVAEHGPVRRRPPRPRSRRPLDT